MIQLVPIPSDPDEPLACSYCEYDNQDEPSDEVGGIWIIDSRPGLYFCSEDCALDWQLDYPEED